MFIPDPIFSIPDDQGCQDLGPRIRIRIIEFNTFKPKNDCKFTNIKSGISIPDRIFSHLGSRIRIPDKKEPGFGSATLRNYIKIGILSVSEDRTSSGTTNASRSNSRVKQSTESRQSEQV
jgi:hypothetical protein